MELNLYLGCVYFDRSKGGANRGVWATEVWREDSLLLSYWKREFNITSNKSVLRAVLFPLHCLEEKGYLPEYQLHIHTIYQYLYRGITQWSEYWLKHDFRGKTSGLTIRNQELWQELLGYKNLLKATHYYRDEDPVISRLLDFCWDEFDNFDGEPALNEGQPVWY